MPARRIDEPTDNRADDEPKKQTCHQIVADSGNEAQKALIQRFADQEGLQIVQSFTEVQSGKDDDERRPQLKAALEAARKAKAPIVVAKLDRLIRLAP